MQNIKKILVVIDPTVERDNAIERAKLIASATGATTNLFINNANTLNENSYLYEGIDPEFFIKQAALYAAHYQQLLERLAAEFTADNLIVSTNFHEEHNLAEAIIKQSVAVKADLVIKSTHHHNVLQRTLISNTDWRLIRKCPAPLLLVKPNKWLANGSVVTAVDPLHAKAEQSRLDHVLVETTEFIAEVLHQHPHIFHSYFPFVSTLFSSSAELTTSLDRIRMQHEQKVQDLLASHAIAKPNIKLSMGELAPNLIEYLTECGANMLVIGALSRSILERAIVGDTAQEILEGCPCDVLVMKQK